MPYVNEVPVKDWTSYQAEVDRILENFEARRSTTSKGLVSAPLFRGQSNQSWPLLTTLERFSSKPWSIKRYHRLLQSVGPAVFSLTSKAWNLGEDPDNVDQSRHVPPPAYEFMIYLRHHGFPSPLLDWSRSPYVAAFFAFEHQPDCEAVAVYVFQEYLGYPKLFSGDGARIIGLGSYVVTHERHYASYIQKVCK